MATYKEIKGVTIQTKDEDPVVNAGTWASGGNLNTARSTSGAGKQTANLAFGGDVPGGRTNICESYDGTSWTEVNDMNTSRSTHAGMGTYTAALAAGGRTSPSASTAASEEWDGSSWTEGNDLNQSRYAINNRGAGTQTAGLCVGGNRRLTPQGTTSPNNASQNFFTGTEEYDGTSWTEVNDVPTGAESGGGLGTQTAAGMWGLYNGSLSSPAYRASGFLYDGTNWTTTTDFPIEGGVYSESGTTTDGLAFGIYNNNTSPTSVANTVAWDGTAWTEVNDISEARYSGGGGKAGADPSQVAIIAGGYTGTGHSANTEEWSFPPVTQEKLKEGMIFLSAGASLKGFGKAAGIPAATWASGGALNQPGRGPVCATAGVSVSSGQIAGGTPNLANTEQYNGTSWTEVNDLNEGRSAVAGTGKLTSALAAGGDSPPGTNVNSTELWDGTNWTETANLNTARRNSAASGDSTTSSLYFGGYTTTYVANTESWDGSSWTEVSDLNSARGYIGGSGSQTSAIAISGEPSPRNYVETWDGSSWTEVTEINTARAQGGSSSFGSKSFALYFGGEPPASTANTEFWNGSSWTEVNDLSTGRSNLDGSGSAASALAVSGGPPTPQTVLTEEFDAPAALSTVTVS